MKDRRANGEGPVLFTHPFIPSIHSRTPTNSCATGVRFVTKRISDSLYTKSKPMEPISVLRRFLSTLGVDSTGPQRSRSCRKPVTGLIFRHQPSTGVLQLPHEPSRTRPGRSYSEQLRLASISNIGGQRPPPIKNSKVRLQSFFTILYVHSFPQAKATGYCLSQHRNEEGDPRRLRIQLLH